MKWKAKVVIIFTNKAKCYKNHLFYDRLIKNAVIQWLYLAESSSLWSMQLYIKDKKAPCCRFVYRRVRCVFYAFVRYYSPSGAVAGAVGSTGVAAGATSELKSAG